MRNRMTKTQTQMKPAIAVTLIIMGSLLVMTPAVSDYLFQRSLVDVLNSHPQFYNVTLDGKMGTLYRFACWLTGTAMIGVAIVCSVYVRKEPVEAKGLAQQAA